MGMFTQNQYDLPGSAVIQLQSPVIPGKMSSFSDQGEHIPPCPRRQACGPRPERPHADPPA
jgi:hypothetical protein